MTSLTDIFTCKQSKWLVFSSVVKLPTGNENRSTVKLIFILSISLFEFPTSLCILMICMEMFRLFQFFFHAHCDKLSLQLS